ncbi:MAG: serine hydrolase, partial [Blautia sp.]|nr:serine hydrolase [Blautia sp.]
MNFHMNRSLITVFAVIAGAMGFISRPVWGEGSLLTISDQAVIRPINDGSGKYLMKSNAYYCLDENGSGSTIEEIHYFDHLQVGNTVLNGYYYHDESGKFTAASPHIEDMTGVRAPAFLSEEDADAGVSEEGGASDELLTPVTFAGCYMVGNLGKLSASPQVRYVDDFTINGKTYDGFYYFDEYGHMDTSFGIHEVQMFCHGVEFDGDYCFGGPEGRLLQEAGETEEGLLIDETGRITNLDQMSVMDLRPRLREMLKDYEGKWEVYLQDLNTEEGFTIGNETIVSASVIKVFVMAKTFMDMERVKANLAERMNTDPEDEAVQKRIDKLLNDMITVSDNESFNELVRLQTERYDFKAGARSVNATLRKYGYQSTSVKHTLSPSSTPEEGIGESNLTSARDCGKLLYGIYNGKCVSEEASAKMLDLLLQQ